MIVKCEHCGCNLSVDHLADHSQMISLVLSAMAKRKKGVPLRLDDAERIRRSERMIEINKSRAKRILGKPKSK